MAIMQALPQAVQNRRQRGDASRSARRQILIKAARYPSGSQPTLANTTKIEVFGGNGNDTISLAT